MTKKQASVGGWVGGWAYTSEIALEHVAWLVTFALLLALFLNLIFHCELQENLSRLTIDNMNNGCCNIFL